MHDHLATAHHAASFQSVVVPDSLTTLLEEYRSGFSPLGNEIVCLSGEQPMSEA
jgi:hypothetical protein